MPAPETLLVRVDRAGSRIVSQATQVSLIEGNNVERVVAGHPAPAREGIGQGRLLGNEELVLPIHGNLEGTLSHQGAIHGEGLEEA